MRITTDDFTYRADEGDAPIEDQLNQFLSGIDRADVINVETIVDGITAAAGEPFVTRVRVWYWR